MIAYGCPDESVGYYCGISTLGKQDRRQPLSSFHGGFVGRTPCLEELHELLSRAVFIPFAVSFDDFQKLLGCFATFAAGVERGRKVESRLMVQRVCRYFLLQFRHRPEPL